MKSKIKLTQEFISKLASEVQDALAVSLKDVENPDELYIIRKAIDDEPNVMEIENADRRLTLGYASTRTVDHDNEIIMPDGMDLSIYRKNPVLLWAHNWSAPPIGKMPEIRSDGYGLFGMSEYAKTKFANDIWELVKGKFLRTHSIGFIPTEYAFRGDKMFDGLIANAIRNWPEFTAESAEKVNRFIVKGIMLENSVVPIPANTDALIQEVAGKDYDEMLIKSVSSECPEFQSLFDEAKKQANGGIDPDFNDDEDDPEEPAAGKKDIDDPEDQNNVIVLRQPVRVVKLPEKEHSVKAFNMDDVDSMVTEQLELMKGKI